MRWIPSPSDRGGGPSRQEYVPTLFSKRNKQSPDSIPVKKNAMFEPSFQVPAGEIMAEAGGVCHNAQRMCPTLVGSPSTSALARRRPRGVVHVNVLSLILANSTNSTWLMN